MAAGWRRRLRFETLFVHLLLEDAGLIKELGREGIAMMTFAVVHEGMEVCIMRVNEIHPRSSSLQSFASGMFTTLQGKC